MEDRHTVTVDHIKQAVAAVKAARPAYQGVLDFYEKLWLAQEASKEKIVLRPVDMSQDVLAIKRKEHFSLISKQDFPVEPKASEALLKALCQLSIASNETLARGASRMVDALDDGALDGATLFSKILDEDDAYWDGVAKDAGVAATVLAFLVYNAVKPSLSLFAEQAGNYLDSETPWQKGYCPVCGSVPALALLRNEGHRFLLCSFCGHEWTVNRLFCPFCENKDQKTLHYFYSDEEKEYRVHVCNVCKKYIKTVDTRNMTRPVHAVVEQVSTLHLDMLAKEQGFESGLPLWLQT
jgi:FdhE protein